MPPAEQPIESQEKLTREEYAQEIRKVIVDKIGHLLGRENIFLVDEIIHRISADLHAIDKDQTIIKDSEKVWERVVYETEQIQLLVKIMIEMTVPPSSKKKTPSGTTNQQSDVDKAIETLTTTGTRILYEMLINARFVSRDKGTEVCEELLRRKNLKSSQLRRVHVILISIYKSKQDYAAAIRTAESLLTLQQYEKAPGNYIEKTTDTIERLRSLAGQGSPEEKAPEAGTPEENLPPISEIKEPEADTAKEDSSPATSDLPEAEAEATHHQEAPTEQVKKTLTALKTWIEGIEERAGRWSSKGNTVKIPDQELDGIKEQLESILDGSIDLLLSTMGSHNGFRSQLQNLGDSLEKGLFRPGLANVIKESLSAQIATMG